MTVKVNNVVETQARDLLALPERLERGELVYFPQCPILPSANERFFLCRQELGSTLHKNISYHPESGTATGYRRRGSDTAERLQRILADFSDRATRWLAAIVPGYAAAWVKDRVSYRPAEEATRKARLRARNDLLHVDAFPSRPTQGRRILRLFVNANNEDCRVWVTSDTFDKLLARYGKAAGLPLAGESGWHGLKQSVLRLFQPIRRQRTIYDSFMLRFHNFLKAREDFQERGPKRFWSFAPGSAWLLFSDTLSHADLRGRYLLDHSFFIVPEALAMPNLAPAAVLERACGFPVLRCAA